MCALFSTFHLQTCKERFSSRHRLERERLSRIVLDDRRHRVRHRSRLLQAGQHCHPQVLMFLRSHITRARADGKSYHHTLLQSVFESARGPRRARIFWKMLKCLHWPTSMSLKTTLPPKSSGRTLATWYICTSMIALKPQGAVAVVPRTQRSYSL